MFLKEYKLQTNPFGPEVVRPYFVSDPGRQALLKLESLLEGHIQCLYLSGPAGAGKSTLVSRRMATLKGLAVSWVRPECDDRQLFLRQLLGDLGLDAIEGTVSELRNIVEVFLRHQAANERRSILVADALETLSVPLLRELEWLSRLRLRNRPVIHLVLLTRSEDLINSFMPEDEGGRLARHVHQRLTGFTLEETQTYIRACLHGAGCHWEEELIPEDVIVDVQGFTHGIVGDINALCCEALARLAQRAASSPAGRSLRLTRSLLKEAGTALQMRYDPTAWQMVEEALTPEAIQLSDQDELSIDAARLFVSSGGRTVAEISLTRPRMVLGRDQSCDISLDSHYVSRYQNLFMETKDGWLLIDLNSTNGSFVNGRRVREHRLRDGDVIAVGRHQLRFVGAAPRSQTAGRHQPEIGPQELEAQRRGEADTLITPPRHADRTV